MSNQNTPDLIELNLCLQSLNAGERIARLYEAYGKNLVASTSFGLQAATMLKLLHENAPKVPVIFVDTGYLFEETYSYAKQLQETYPLDYRGYQPKLSPKEQEEKYGKLWEQGKEGNEKYAIINKIEPMNRALNELQAQVWISGLRREQSSTRATRSLIEQQRSTIKAYPILDWTDQQVTDYYTSNNITPHPLQAQGYITMGDWHSTTKPTKDGDKESTRFGGNKYECGLHLDSGNQDFQI